MGASAWRGLRPPRVVQRACSCHRAGGSDAKRQLTRRRMIEDERVRQRCRLAQLGLQLVAQLHRAE